MIGQIISNIELKLCVNYQGFDNKIQFNSIQFNMDNIDGMDTMDYG